MKNNKPTPAQFARTFLTLMLPVILAFIVFLMFVGCAPTEEVYKVNGPEMYTIYKNKTGDLIELPWNSEECMGYKKPYHTTQYNVGRN